jgi:plasmid stabilization system protein ParE
MRWRLTKRADADLDRIWDYIAQDNPFAADRVEQDLYDVFARLANNPSLGHFRDDLADRRYRFYREYSYIIVYRIYGRTMRIVRVLHGARDMTRLFPH